MATEKFEGMVVLDGVRYRKNDLKRIHPERVADAKPADIPAEPVFDKVTTVPGGVVVGNDAQGAPVVDTEQSAAGNAPVVVEEGGVADGDASGETGRSGDGDKAAGKRSGSRARSSKG